MKNINVFIIVFVALASCSSPSEEELLIKGYLENSYGDETKFRIVEIEELDPITGKDSAMILQNFLDSETDKQIREYQEFVDTYYETEKAKNESIGSSPLTFNAQAAIASNRELMEDWKIKVDSIKLDIERLKKEGIKGEEYDNIYSQIEKYESSSDKILIRKLRCLISLNGNSVDEASSRTFLTDAGLTKVLEKID